MGFFEREDKARVNTTYLVFLFSMAVSLVVVTTYFLVLAIFFRNGPNMPPLWEPQLFYKVAIVLVTIIAAASLFKIFSLSNGGTAVAEYLGARRIDPGSKDPGERTLLNVVEEIAIASGTPVPPVYVMDDERSINAFAAGLTPGDSVITVTKGTLGFLNRDELQGVIAHEFSHIVNGDIKLNIRLMGILNGILFLGIVGRSLIRGPRSDDRRGGGQVALFGLALFILGYVGVFFGQLIRSAVSRQREYLADASAVQFTRNPGGISGALKKIGGCFVGRNLFSAQAQEVSHMLFDSEETFDWMASHPPLDKRIRAIDPQFDGTFIEPKAVDYDLQKDSALETLKVYEKRARGENALTPLQLLSQNVGVMRAAHLDSSKALIQNLEPNKELAYDTVKAQGLIFAFLVYESAGESYPTPYADYLKSKLEPYVVTEIFKMLQRVQTIGQRERLSLIEMSFPALKNMSRQQYDRFKETVVGVVHCGPTVPLFDFCVASMVIHYLDQNYYPSKPTSVNLKNALPDIQIVISAVAEYGNEDPVTAQKAFDAAAMVFPKQFKFELEKVLPDQLWKALDRLNGASLEIKSQIIDALGISLRFDGKITLAEMELARTISKLLDCPMPPIDLH